MTPGHILTETFLDLEYFCSSFSKRKRYWEKNQWGWKLFNCSLFCSCALSFTTLGLFPSHCCCTPFSSFYTIFFDFLLLLLLYILQVCAWECFNLTCSLFSLIIPSFRPRTDDYKDSVFPPWPVRQWLDSRPFRVSGSVDHVRGITSEITCAHRDDQAPSVNSGWEVRVISQKLVL